MLMLHMQLNYVGLLRCTMLLSCLNALLDCDLEDEMCFHVWVSAVTFKDFLYLCIQFTLTANCTFDLEFEW